MMGRPPAGASHRLTVRAASRLLDVGLVSSEELCSFCHSLAVAGEEVWTLNAFANLLSRDDVLDAAQESDHRRQHGTVRSVFDGIPLSFKANMAVRTEPLTAGSLILGFGGRGDTEDVVVPPPCGYDADVVRVLLRDKGGVLVGTTSMDEFGMGSLGTNSRYSDGRPRHTKNPLPYLRHLRWDDDENDDDDDGGRSSPGNQRTGEWESQRLAAIIRLPHEAILERHHEALLAALAATTTKMHRQNGSNDSEEAVVFSAGGSSCGSAASVAHGSSLLSLGTDTGGSVRLPAAWCGLVGLKPSYGLLSRHGVVSYASSFDTVGIIASSVGCAAAALDVLEGTTAGTTTVSRDSTLASYHGGDDDDAGFNSLCELGLAQVSEGSSDPTKALLAGVRVGIPPSFSVQECPADISDAWGHAAECLERHGAEIVELSPASITPGLVQRALSAYYVLVSAEASSNLSRYDGFRYGVAAEAAASDEDEDEDAAPGDGGGSSFSSSSDLTPLERQYAATRRRGFGTEVARRILCGTSVLSSDRFHTHYEAAARLRADLTREMTAVLEDDVDLLLIPTALSTTPPQIQDGRPPPDNTAMFANDVMTVPASLSGLPAVSVPVPIGRDGTFLAGMQLIGSRRKESLILKAAKVLESATPIEKPT